MRATTLQHLLIALFFSALSCRAQLVCDPSVDSLIELTDTDFDTIDTKYETDWNEDVLMPSTIHWHISIVDDSQVPSYAVHPEGLLEPKYNGRKLLFKNDKGIEHMGYSQGDSIEAAITIYVPVSQLRSVSISGVDQNVELLATDETLNIASNTTDFGIAAEQLTLNVEMSGVDNRLFINTPYHQVSYEGSGVDSAVYMSAASGSTYTSSGVDHRGQVKTEHLDWARLTGVDSYLLLEGSYGYMDLKGVDTRVSINGEMGCENVDRSGIDSSCQSSTQEVTIDTLQCMAETKVVIATCFDWSMGVIIAVAVGVLVVVIGMITLCCCCMGWCCFAACKSRRHKEPITVVVPPPKTHGAAMPQQPGIIEASVVEVKPMEGVTGTEGYGQDPEQAKQTPGAVHQNGYAFSAKEGAQIY